MLVARALSKFNQVISSYLKYGLIFSNAKLNEFLPQSVFLQVFISTS